MKRGVQPIEVIDPLLPEPVALASLTKLLEKTLL